MDQALIERQNEERIRVAVENAFHAWRVHDAHPVEFALRYLNQGAREQLMHQAIIERVVALRDAGRAPASRVVAERPPGDGRVKVETNIWRRSLVSGVEVFEVAYRDEGRQRRLKCVSLEEARAERERLQGEGKIRGREGVAA